MSGSITILVFYLMPAWGYKKDDEYPESLHKVIFECGLSEVQEKKGDRDFPYTTAEKVWKAVLKRNPGLDGCKLLDFEESDIVILK